MVGKVAQANDEPVVELQQFLERQHVGALSPLRVELIQDRDAEGESAWFVTVVLADPDPVSGAWPIEDVVEFQRLARDEALVLAVPWPWYLRFKPATDVAQAEDEDSDEL